jgi:hypothetical protein
MTTKLYSDIIRHIASFLCIPSGMNIVCREWRQSLNGTCIKENGGLETVNTRNPPDENTLDNLVGPKTKKLRLTIYSQNIVSHLTTYTGLVKLILIGKFNFNVTHFPPFPPNLKRLNLDSFSMVKEIPTLPLSLEILKIWKMPMLERIPTLPLGLYALDIWRLPLVQVIPRLPPTIKQFNGWEMPLIRKIPELPILLQQLELQEFPQVAVIRHQLPKKLKVLILKRLENLIVVPELPPFLEKIELYNLNTVQDLELPKTIKYMKIKNLPNITVSLT